MQPSVFILTVIFALIASNVPQINGKSDQCKFAIKVFCSTYARTCIYMANVTLTAHVYVMVRNALQEKEKTKFSIYVSLALFQLAALLRRCYQCRSRGELGSCKDPFTFNATDVDSEPGLSAIPCASGWCGKVIEGGGPYAIDGNTYTFTFIIEHNKTFKLLSRLRPSYTAHVRAAWTR